MQRFFLLLALVSVATVSFPAHTASAANRPQPILVRIIDQNMAVRSSFSVISANDAGGMSVAVGDLGRDGISEIVLGSGLGNEPRVHAYRGDGSPIGSFLAYDGSMGSGVHVAVCDLDGDGTNEIATAPMRGGAPHVRVFNNYGAPLDPGFFAYGESMTAGVSLACGDMDGDGAADLATLPSAGAGPHIKIWKRVGESMTLARELFLSDATDERGLVGTIGNKILRVAAQSGENHDTFDVKLSTEKISVDVIEHTDDAAGATGMFSSNERTYRTTTDGRIIDVDSFASSTYETEHGTLTAASGDIDGDGTAEIVAVDSRVLFGGYATGKSIEVDLSEQRLYAFNNGLVDASFLISTARASYQTPLGEHRITAKVPLVHYAGGSGADAYDLGWIPYNLRFYPHIYIHYAPWNNQFGYTLSRGCVNASLEHMRWIYDWSSVGIPVTVRS